MFSSKEDQTGWEAAASLDAPKYFAKSFTTLRDSLVQGRAQAPGAREPRGGRGLVQLGEALGPTLSTAKRQGGRERMKARKEGGKKGGNEGRQAGIEFLNSH